MVGTNFEDIEVDHNEDKDINTTDLDKVMQYVINLVDNITVLLFSAECFLRLIVCPIKWKFVSNRMNIIDLLAITHFFLSAVLAGLEDMQVIGKAGNVIRLIRIIRILRVFKKVRHFSLPFS